MSTRHELGSLAVAASLALGSAAALGQGTDPQGAQQGTPQGVTTQGAQQQGAQPQPQAPSGNPQAAPQIWLADAALFIANGSNAARVLDTEQGLSVKDPSVLGNQAQFLVASINRALSSLNTLQQNAEASKAPALPSVKSAIGQLTAAQAQAQQILTVASSGTFGPGYQASLQATLDQLKQAAKNVDVAAKSYGMPGFAVSACPPSRAGGETR